MKALTITEARRRLGQVADAALKGRPTLIVRNSRILVLQAYKPVQRIPLRPPGYFEDCYTEDEIHEVNFLAAQGTNSIRP